MRVLKIPNDPDVTKARPCDIENKDNVPMTTYYLCKTVRNKLLHYKETINSIFVHEEFAFSLNTETFECEHS